MFSVTLSGNRWRRTFNRNWDGAWRVATKTSADGWSAEFAIPFSTLRYARRGAGEVAERWGVNFQRSLRRRKETAFWAPLSRQLNL